MEDTALFDRARELGWGGDYVPEQEVSAQVAVICYFTEELSADKLEKLKAELFGLADFGFDPGGPVEISAAYVDEEDWAQAWKEHYHPFRIGQVAVQPSWVPEENRRARKWLSAWIRVWLSAAAPILPLRFASRFAAAQSGKTVSMGCGDRFGHFGSGCGQIGC